MKYRIFSAFVAVLMLSPMLVSCFSSPFMHHGFFAMDTYVTVDARTSDSGLLKDVENLVYEDERLFSRTFAGTKLYELNEKGEYDVGEETARIISTALEICEATDGAFNPCMGSLIELWDIKSENPRVPTDSEISSLLGTVDSSLVKVSGSTVTIPEGMKIDLGGIAKGCSAEKVIGLLRARGVSDALVGFGGSIACIGSPSDGETWSVGIRNPFDTGSVVGTLKVTDCIISVSGSYERYFEKDGKRYHHILDPKTGKPSESDIESVAVISKSGAVSDALSTALFVMGFEEALGLYKGGIYDFEAVFVMKNRDIVVTRGLEGAFTKDDGYKAKVTYR